MRQYCLLYPQLDCTKISMPRAEQEACSLVYTVARSTLVPSTTMWCHVQRFLSCLWTFAAWPLQIFPTWRAQLQRTAALGDTDYTHLRPHPSRHCARATQCLLFTEPNSFPSFPVLALSAFPQLDFSLVLNNTAQSSNQPPWKRKSISALPWWPGCPSFQLTKPRVLSLKKAVVWYEEVPVYWLGLHSPMNNRKTTYSHLKNRGFFFSFNKKLSAGLGSQKSVMSGSMCLWFSWHFSNDSEMALQKQPSILYSKKKKVGRQEEATSSSLVFFFRKAASFSETSLSWPAGLSCVP